MVSSDAKIAAACDFNLQPSSFEEPFWAVSAAPLFAVSPDPFVFVSASPFVADSELWVIPLVFVSAAPFVADSEFWVIPFSLQDTFASSACDTFRTSEASEKEKEKLKIKS